MGEFSKNPFSKTHKTSEHEDQNFLGFLLTIMTFTCISMVESFSSSHDECSSN